jgi:hypothetical protein
MEHGLRKAELERAAAGLLGAALADSTKKGYASMLKPWIAFLTLIHGGEGGAATTQEAMMRLPTDKEVVLYAAYLADLHPVQGRAPGKEKGYGPRSVRTYMSALRMHYLQTHNKDVLANNARYNLVMRAVGRRGRGKAQAKLPIGGYLVRYMVLMIKHLKREKQEAAFIRMLLVLYGFMCRVSEVASAGTKIKDEHLCTYEKLTYRDACERIIPWGELEKRRTQVKYLDFKWTGSKTDQLMEGEVHSISWQGGDFCVVKRTLEEAIKAEGRQSARMTAVGMPARAFQARLRFWLGKVIVDGKSLDPSKYTTHGLRAGACSDLFARGIPADTVKYLGRWKSDCYTTYTFSARGRCEGLYELMLSTPHQRYLNSET